MALRENSSASIRVCRDTNSGLPPRFHLPLLTDFLHPLQFVHVFLSASSLSSMIRRIVSIPSIADTNSILTHISAWPLPDFPLYTAYPSGEKTPLLTKEGWPPLRRTGLFLLAKHYSQRHGDHSVPGVSPPSTAVFATGRAGGPNRKFSRITSSIHSIFFENLTILEPEHSNTLRFKIRRPFAVFRDTYTGEVPCSIKLNC